jgi:hypothetical protein
MHEMPWDPQTAPSRAVLDALVGPREEPSGPRPIATVTPEPETAYLLFCPEQGGWHVGEWWTVEGSGRWVAAIDTQWGLEPTHWMPAPADPE